MASVDMHGAYVVASASDFHYRAFISYSHADEAWGKWLHKALETWRAPSRHSQPADKKNFRQQRHTKQETEPARDHQSRPTRKTAQRVTQPLKRPDVAGMRMPLPFLAPARLYRGGLRINSEVRFAVPFWLREYALHRLMAPDDIRVEKGDRGN
jgi:hypothetical protein